MYIFEKLAGNAYV